MRTSENVPHEMETPFVLYLDTTGRLAYHPGVHTLNCGEPTHVNRTLNSASEVANTERCPQCGESAHFTGSLQKCPDCVGTNAQCPVCQGRGAQPCLYIVSTPRTGADSFPNLTKASFRASVEEAWGDVLTEFDTLVNTAQGLAVYLFGRSAGQTDEHEVLARMAGRACQIADAVSCLLHAGHPDVAFAQSRMLLEIEFNMMAIHNDTSSDVAEKFREWGFGKMFRDIKNLNQLGLHEMDESEYKKMATEYQALRDKHGRSFMQDKGWIGKDVFQRAKGINQEVDYRKFYAAASSFVHTDARALFSPIGLSQRNKGGILVGPSGIGLDLAAMRTAMSLVHIMIQLPNMLEVEEDEQTSAAFEIIVKSTDAMMLAVESVDPKNLRATLPTQDE